jgi:Ca2+/Na+ antiporter
MTLEAKILQLDIPVMIAMALLLPLFSWKYKQLGRLGGASMLALYVAYSLNLFFNWI